MVAPIGCVRHPRLLRALPEPGGSRVEGARLSVEAAGHPAALGVDPAANGPGQAGEGVQLSSEAVILVGHVIQHPGSPLQGVGVDENARHGSGRLAAARKRAALTSFMALPRPWALAAIWAT